MTTMRVFITITTCLLLLSTAAAFSSAIAKNARPTSTALFSNTNTRRQWIRQAAATLATATTTLSPRIVHATETATSTTIETKTFIDPQGLFGITVPKNFFTLRRSAKGDLPDSKTGQGRRGSSIFTAGDMAKAEVVAVERFPTRVLLEEAGITASGDLSTFPKLGEPAAVANLINLRREKDKPGNLSKTVVLPESLQVSPDGLELSFTLKTEIEVQKPELLMEQYGVSQLFRITNAKASLASRDGNIMAVFASALQQDYDGPDGEALRNVVNSFTVTNQESAS